MKIKFAIIKNLLSLLLTISFFAYSCTPKKAGSIKIGADLPLTGNFSYYGNEVKNALAIAQEHDTLSIIEFDFEDNQSQASNSVNVFNKLVINKEMPLIISCNSPLSLPLRPMAEKNEVVLLALVTGAKDFGAVNIWSFRDAINQEQEGAELANYIINKTSFRKAGTLVVNDDYGLDGVKSFGEIFLSKGGAIVSEQTFKMNELDLRSSITKILDKKPEFLLIIGREQSLITAINQVREQNKNILILTSDAFESPTVISGLGENSRGIVFSSYYNNLDSDEGMKFVADYSKKFNKTPGIYAIDAYVAAQYLKNIFIQTGNDKEKIRASLSNLQFESGIKGKLQVNHKRDVISPVSIFIIDDQLKKTEIQ